MSGIKNKIISVHSTLGKDRAVKKRRKPRPSKELQPRDTGMSGLKAALIILPILVVIILGVLLAVILKQVTDNQQFAGPKEPASSTVTSREEDTQRLLLIVSPKSPLPGDYEHHLTDFQNVRIDEALTEDLTALLSDAAKEGLSLRLIGGYVSAAEQNELYQDEVRRLIAREGQSSARAAEDAELTVPKGNHADEQTGLSVRFSSDRSIDFSQSAEYLWLLKNAYKYGFILRYPDNKQRYTDRDFDSSLFRYVGKDNALRLKTLNMCLDEYIIYLHSRSS